MKNLTVIKHPLITRDVSLLRDVNTSNDHFRTVLSRVAGMMAFEVTKDFALESYEVKSPMEAAKGFRLKKTIVVVPVLRAGLGMVEGFLNVLPEARVGHVGLYRNEETLMPVEYYSKFPRQLPKALTILIDPMLATGGSAAAAISFLKQRGAKDIRMICLVAAPPGVKKVAAAHPDVQIFTATLDKRLNDKGYILPGLGDAGDRIFGTE